MENGLKEQNIVLAYYSWTDFSAWIFDRRKLLILDEMVVFSSHSTGQKVYKFEVYALGFDPSEMFKFKGKSEIHLNGILFFRLFLLLFRFTDN